MDASHSTVESDAGHSGTNCESQDADAPFVDGLVSLAVTGELVPAFDPDVFDYDLTVPLLVHEFSALARTSSNTTLTVNGNFQGTNCELHVDLLGAEETAVVLEIASPSGEVRTYRIQVHHPALTETSLPVPNDVTALRFNTALSHDGNTFAAGPYFLPTPDAPGVHVYSRKQGVWDAGIPIACHPDGGEHQRGCSVALSGDGNTLALGDVEGTGASVLENRDGTWTRTHEVRVHQTPLESGETIGGGFGDDVALSADGNTFAATEVGIPSSIVVFRKDASDWEIDGHLPLVAPGVAERPERCVNNKNAITAVVLSADGSTMVAGASPLLVDEERECTGIVNVYARGASGWQHTATVSTLATYGGFGDFLALSADGKTLAVTHHSRVELDGTSAGTSIYSLGAQGWSEVFFTPNGGYGVGLAAEGDVFAIDAGVYALSGQTWVAQGELPSGLGSVTLSGDGRTAVNGSVLLTNR